MEYDPDLPERRMAPAIPPGNMAASLLQRLREADSRNATPDATSSPIPGTPIEGASDAVGTNNSAQVQEISPDGAAFRVHYDPNKGVYVDMRETPNTSPRLEKQRPKYSKSDTFLAERLMPRIGEGGVIAANSTAWTMRYYAIVGTVELFVDTPIDLQQPITFVSAAAVGSISTYISNRKKFRNRTPLIEAKPKSPELARAEQMDGAAFVAADTISVVPDTNTIPEYYGVDGNTIPAFELLDFLYMSRDIPSLVIGVGFVNGRLRRARAPSRTPDHQDIASTTGFTPMAGDHYNVDRISIDPAAVLAKVISDPAATEGYDDFVGGLVDPILDVHALQQQKNIVIDRISDYKKLPVEQLPTARALRQQEVTRLEADKSALEARIIHTTLDITAAYLAQREEAYVADVTSEAGDVKPPPCDVFSSNSEKILAAAHEDMTKTLGELLFESPIAKEYERVKVALLLETFHDLAGNVKV